MAWTFIEQLPVERTSSGAYLYRMSITDGSETRTEYYKSPVAMTNPQLATARDVILFRMNNPPPQDTTLRQVRLKLAEIDASNAGTTNAIKAAKWDAVLAYRDNAMVGGNP